MQNIISRLLRFFIKLLLAAFGLVFALSLLAAALVVVVLSLLKSLITGQKPAPAMVFGKFQKFSPGSMWPGATQRDDSAKAGDVVDVEMREVKTPESDKRLP